MLAAYIIHKADTPRFCRESAARGVLRSGGLYWNRPDNEWQDATRPRDIFSPSERDAYTLPAGGEWIEIYLDESLGAA